MRSLLKSALNAIFLLFVAPLAALSGFGRIESLYVFGAQWCAMIPGLPGDYMRIAFCRLTLEACSPESRLQFGTFFAHPQARIGKGVYIGSYCVLGRTSIGDRTQIASHVQILSGKKQHGRDADGRMLGADHGRFETILIGEDCWIGAGAIVMAEVGAGSTVGAGAVVTRPVPPCSVVVGNPAKPLGGTTSGATT